MGSDQPPGQKPPTQPATASESKPAQPPQPATQTKPSPSTPAKPAQPGQGKPPTAQRPPGQQRPPGSAPRPPSRPKYGENKDRSSEYLTMPFVFISFLFGLANMMAVPVIYVYEIIKNNEKNEWPAWSGIDGLNYLFYSKNPLFARNDMLYHLNPQGLPSLAIDLHIPAVTKFVNGIAVGYLDMAVAFICFLQGVVFMWLAVRVAIRVLDKPK